MKRKLAVLFKELCCSACRADFDENSVNIIREEKGEDEELIVFKLVCQKCGKSFGVAFLGIPDVTLKNYSEEDLVLKIQERAEPITTDEVLDAHKFIKELDKDWTKFIEDIKGK